MEIESLVPGDDLVPHARVTATRAIDLAAPPEQVWPWLVQMGFGRAGWYSYDWLDNLGRRSAWRIHAEWQHLEQGDAVPAGPTSFVAKVVDEPRAFVLGVPSSDRGLRGVAFTLAYELRPGVDSGTRLVTRVRIRVDLPLGRLIERFLLGPGDGVMVRRQLLNLRERTKNCT
jgi:hypothetical protein